MRKTFTITHSNGNETMKVEAVTRVDAIDIAMARGAKDLNKVQGSRFTDSLRSKPRKAKNGRPSPVNDGQWLNGTPPEAGQEVAFLGTRAAVRNLARM